MGLCGGGVSQLAASNMFLTVKLRLISSRAMSNAASEECAA